MLHPGNRRGRGTDAGRAVRRLGAPGGRSENIGDDETSRTPAGNGEHDEEDNEERDRETSVASGNAMGNGAVGGAGNGAAKSDRQKEVTA